MQQYSRVSKAEYGFTTVCFSRRKVGWLFLGIALAWMVPPRASALPCTGYCIGGTNHGERCVSTVPDCPGVGAICDIPAGCVYLEWRPNQVVVPPNGTAQLHLYAYSSNGFDQPIFGIDFILNWDEARAQFLGKQDPCLVCSGGPNNGDLCQTGADCPSGFCGFPDACFTGCPPQTYGWFSSFFPNDSGLDGLNAPYAGLPGNDGDAFHQAISHSFCGVEQADPAMAPPYNNGTGGLLVTTFLFRPLITTGGILVSTPLDQGEFTHTRVVGGAQAGEDILGSPVAQAQIIVSDLCDVPTVSALGCRYIGVTPAAGSNAVAIRVRGSSSDSQVSCVDQYVQANCVGGTNAGAICDDNGDCLGGGTCTNTGTLGTTAVYRTPAQWGTVPVRGSQIQPSKSYRVQVDCGPTPGQLLSSVVNVTMRPWGDATGTGLPINFIDISKVIDGFRGIAGIAIEETDMTGTNCIPQRIVNFIDVTAAVDAFRTIPFPCAAPCP